MITTSVVWSPSNAGASITLVSIQRDLLRSAATFMTEPPFGENNRDPK
jgi:hypothetical protein